MSTKVKITTVELLIPMAMMGFAFMLFLAFQVSQIMTDRDSMNQILGGLKTPYEQSQNLNKQFGGLVAGSQKLANDGNKSVRKIVEKLREIGVIVEPKKESKEPVTGANKVPPKGPKKP